MRLRLSSMSENKNREDENENETHSPSFFLSLRSSSPEMYAAAFQAIRYYISSTVCTTVITVALLRARSS